MFSSISFKQALCLIASSAALIGDANALSTGRHLADVGTFGDVFDGGPAPAPVEGSYPEGTVPEAVAPSPLDAAAGPTDAAAGPDDGLLGGAAGAAAGAGAAATGAASAAGDKLGLGSDAAGPSGSPGEADKPSGAAALPALTGIAVGVASMALMLA